MIKVTKELQKYAQRAALAGCAGAALVLVGCDDDDDDNTPAVEMSSVYDAASADGRFSTLVAAIDAAGLATTLDDLTAGYTVFAPTDDAFKAFLSARGLTAAQLLASPDLSDILLYHVLGSEVDAAAALTQDGAAVATLLSNNAIIVDDLAGNVLINDATVTEANLMTDNGIIHVVDTVLEIPTDLISTLDTRGYTTLSAALTQEIANLNLPTDDNTILVPTNAAFEAYMSANSIPDAATLLAADSLPDVLADHVVDPRAPASTVADLGFVTTLGTGNYAVDASSGSIVLGGAVTVTAANIPFVGGIIHVVDTVVPSEEGFMSVYDVAANDDNFSTLALAIRTAELDDDLDVIGTSYTVFAPTNDAFNAFLTARDLTASELLGRDDLADILLYHVLGSEVDSTTALTVNGENDLDVLRTLQGKKIIVDDIADAAVWINATTVTSADIVAENGIVHVIDGVLVPPMSLADTIEDRGLTTLGAALTQELSEGLALPSNPNTLLGPTDAAFTTLLGSLGISAAELLANDSLDEVLADHVVDLRAPASTVASLTASGVTTAGGNTYTVSTSDGIVLNSNAAVSARNIPYNGGVLHIIDAVLPANYVAPPVGTPEIGGPGVLLPAASN